ncbi:helix-turn-helix transcriptional regulator [Nocardiopsis sp. CNT312]|uniref:helix-turn-helix domain-containing protein n=1 Tax=Nocardiopsis sp. CNT312 TaxID=1137268 RepID=UPI0004B5BAD5|nr:helix-turn-helix transcriptional regulator [Nocardiopsis sp. CNT312]
MSQHHPSCAKRLRERAQDQGLDLAATAQSIHQCCHVSRLRAHRLARGWTQAQAVEQYRRLAAQVPGAAKMDADQLSRWETGAYRPRARTIDLLCRLYDTNAHELGMAGDYRTSAPESTRQPAWLTPGPASAEPSGSALAAAEQRADRARRGLDRTLAQASLTPVQLDLLDERLAWVRFQYLHEPPAPMLDILLADIDEVHTLLTQRQPATVQAHLAEITALQATLVADALMKLGCLRQAVAWFTTARTAADESTTTELRARVRAQAAMLPYYYGPLDTAITLARDARMLSREKPTATGAFAAAAEARALARRGDRARAQEAIALARTMFERCTPGPTDDAFAFPERRLLLYLSGAYTYLGQSQQAQQVQHRALALYPNQRGIDPALIRLEEAICLARDRHLTEACDLAQDTFLSVADEHRTPLLAARARDVLEVLPSAMRSARAARQLSDALCLPAATR